MANLSFEAFVAMKLWVWVWDDGSKLKKIAVEKKCIAPSQIDYAAYCKEYYLSPEGEKVVYTLNPELKGVDFAKAKPFIPDTRALQGKTFQEVLRHLVSTYGKTHMLPDLTYEYWLYSNRDNRKVWPREFADAKFSELYFPGSLLRRTYWTVSYVAGYMTDTGSKSTGLYSHFYNAEVLLLER